jgi:putative ABC transport system permease protein
LGALDLRAAIRGSVDLLFSASRFDIALRLSEPWPAEALESAVLGVTGVARAEAWGGARAALVGVDGRAGNAFTISAPPASTRMFTPSLQRGRWPGRDDDNALVVSRRLLADEPQLVLGETVTLLVDGQESSWRVVGVADTGLSPVAYTSRETLARVTGRSEVDRVVVAGTGQGNVAQLDLVQRLRTALEAGGIGVSTSQLTEQHRRVLEDHLLMVASFLGVMGQLMIVVAGLGLGSTMSLGVLERTREIAVLRAIGARHRSILAMVQIEGLVVSILGWALALPLSIPMSLVLGWAFGRVMVPVPVIYLPQLTAVLQWLGVVVVVSVIASAWPAYRATRIPTARALAYE